MYDTEVWEKFKDLQKKENIDPQVLWATADVFHELGHIREKYGSSQEKEADRFSLKMTKEYLKENPSKKEKTNRLKSEISVGKSKKRKINRKGNGSSVKKRKSYGKKKSKSKRSFSKR
jgi:hypothetical protein